MKTRSYSVVGDKKQGHRIAVPESINPEAGDMYDFHPCDESGYAYLPKGSLVYVPAPRPTSKREKKGVSG